MSTGRDTSSKPSEAILVACRPIKRVEIRYGRELLGNRWDNKRVFLESPFLLCPLKVCSLNKGREETDSPKTPFWTTVSPHDAFAAPLAHSEIVGCRAQGTELRRGQNAINLSNLGKILPNVINSVKTIRSEKNCLNIKFVGGIFLGHPGSRRRDIPDKNFMQVALFCCFRQGMAGMSRDLGRDVRDLEKLYARKLWADFAYPKLGAL